VTPVTSPPLTSTTFDATRLEGHDLLYIDLHGWPGAPVWLGQSALDTIVERRNVALTVEQIGNISLLGTVVFAATCYLADDESPMLDALLDAGARYVIGGEGINWNGMHNPIGAGLLGQWLRGGMQLGIEPLRALALAKQRVSLSLVQYRLRGMNAQVTAARDALAFRAYERRKQ